MRAPSTGGHWPAPGLPRSPAADSQVLLTKTGGCGADTAGARLGLPDRLPSGSGARPQASQVLLGPEA